MAEKTIDGYIASLSDWRGTAVRQLHEAIGAAAPDATAAIKWAQPVYSSNGPFAYIKAFPRSVNVGFWRGAELPDPDGLLEGDGDRMRHVTLRSLEAVDAAAIDAFAREAVRLNRERGDPTRRS
ncbi:MAG TPA: DUF1801 domain-containing protein [Candidatus Limnocylindrales bacterium]|nr:DUF1801 domain-containing protein [Candidatus Limnocylindrales bacterium]